MIDKLEQYIEQHASLQDALLSELDRETNLRAIQPKMISGRVQGAFLKICMGMLKPQRVLEIGTFTGYSALSMAAGLEDGAEIDTIEVDDELCDFAQSFFDRSPHGKKIHLHIGSALEIAPRLGKLFDFVFIDGNKRQYGEYYHMLMGTSETPPLVHSGSVIFADNVLWYGKVVEDVKHGDKMSQGILEFNTIVANDNRVESVIIPLRDGINMVRVK